MTPEYLAGAAVRVGVVVSAGHDNTSRFLCGSHAWPFDTSSARLSLLQVLHPYRPAFLLSNNVSIDVTYIHSSWRSDLVNANGSSAGGHVLMLQGGMFCHAGEPGLGSEAVTRATSASSNSTASLPSPSSSASSGDACSSMRFTCRWEESPGVHRGHIVEADAELLDSRTLKCTTPAWPYPAARTRLTIIDRSKSSILGYVPSYTKEAEYRFLPDIRNVSTGEGGNPPQILAAGTADMAIAAVGLDPQQSYTALLMADSYNRAGHTLILQAYACKTISTILIRCTFPPPPDDLEAQAVHIHVYEGAGGSEVGSKVTCCGAPGCICADMSPAIYVEAWVRASTNTIYLHGCAISDTPCPDMQQFIYIDGAGFNTSATYACSFAGDGITRTTLAHSPLSPSRVACPLPGSTGVAGFGSFEGSVMLSLLRFGQHTPSEVRLYGSR